MSDLTYNKVAGAVLATGLAIVGLREISSGVFAPHPVEKPGYAIEVAEDAGAAGGGAEAPIDWGTVLPTADIKAGEAIFAKCKSCHKIDGTNATGPHLDGVVGRAVASIADFTYSDGMKAHGGNWDPEALETFLANPKGVVAGTKMTFAGLPKIEDRANVIKYLESLGG